MLRHRLGRTPESRYQFFTMFFIIWLYFTKTENNQIH